MKNKECILNNSIRELQGMRKDELIEGLILLKEIRHNERIELRNEAFKESDKLKEKLIEKTKITNERNRKLKDLIEDSKNKIYKRIRIIAKSLNISPYTIFNNLQSEEQFKHLIEFGTSKTNFPYVKDCIRKSLENGTIGDFSLCKNKDCKIHGCPFNYKNSKSFKNKTKRCLENAKRK